MLLDIECPQLSKPKAKGDSGKKPKQKKPQSLTPPLANQRTVYDYDSGSVTSQSILVHSEYLTSKLIIQFLELDV